MHHAAETSIAATMRQIHSSPLFTQYTIANMSDATLSDAALLTGRVVTPSAWIKRYVLTRMLLSQVTQAELKMVPYAACRSGLFAVACVTRNSCWSGKACSAESYNTIAGVADVLDVSMHSETPTSLAKVSLASSVLRSLGN